MTAIKPEQIRWRIGSTSKDGKKGMLLGYIDARTAMDLLDEQDAKWSDEYREVSIDGRTGIQCALTVNGVTRTDVGVPSNTEGLKGAYSDALKRAAVKHGIGRELYELPRIWVTLDEYKRPTAEPAFVKGRWQLPQGSGSVFYDHEPTDPPVARAGVPAAGGASPAPPQDSPAASDYEDASALFDDVLEVTGGTEVTPFHRDPNRAETECPEHHKARKRGKGLYCPTPTKKRGDQVLEWCDWEVAA